MEIFRLIFCPIEVNTYILADQSGDCAIIDCGCYNKMEFNELKTFLKDKNLRPTLLLNTHCHLDHIFGNKFMLEHYNLRTYSSELEEFNRINSVQHSMLYGMTMDEPPEPAGFITDNQIISFGSNPLIALHVPGHTAGSIAFYSKENGVVFTGDALFSGSIGRTDLPGGNYETLINSIKNKLFVLPSSTIVYSGHGEQTTIGKELSTNPFFS